MDKKNDIKKILKGFKMDYDLIEYISEGINYCIKNNIVDIDIVLEKQIYPILSERYNLSFRGIETRLRRSINNWWNNNKHGNFEKYCDYYSRPTIKKLFILVLQKVRQ